MYIFQERVKIIFGKNKMKITKANRDQVFIYFPNLHIS